MGTWMVRRLPQSSPTPLAEVSRLAKSGLACVASVSVGFGSKERPRNWIFGVFPPPPPPLSSFWLSHHFRAGKTLKIPFLWLSLLPIPTETLATQAKSGCDSDSSISKRRSKHALNSIHNHRNYKIIDSNAMDWASGHKNATSETISRPGIAIESLADIKTAAQDNCSIIVR